MEEKKEYTEAEKLLTEIKTVETLLDRGVRVTLPAPFLLRLFRKRTIDVVLTRPTCEVVYRISGLYLQMKAMATRLEVELIDEAQLLVNECMRPASRIVAYAVKPKYTASGLINRMIARFLRKRLDTRELAELWTIVVGLSGTQDFSNIIRSMSAMRMTIPRVKET